MRTIVNLPKEQLQALDHYRREHGLSRTEAVRKAVAAFLPTLHGKGPYLNHPAVDSLKEQCESVDFVRKLRTEWDP